MDYVWSILYMVEGVEVISSGFRVRIIFREVTQNVIGSSQLNTIRASHFHTFFMVVACSV